MVNGKCVYLTTPKAIKLKEVTITMAEQLEYISSINVGKHWGLGSSNSTGSNASLFAPFQLFYAQIKIFEILSLLKIKFQIPIYNIIILFHSKHLFICQ